MIAYRQEKLADAKSDIESLLPAQWAQTGEQGLTCAPNWRLYGALEQSGNGALFMAREGEWFRACGRPVGYLVSVIYPHPNSEKYLIGYIPTYFIEARTTRALLMRTLLAHGVGWCRGRGAVRVDVETDYDHSAGRILEAMHFRPVKIGYRLDIAQETARCPISVLSKD